MVNGAAGAVGSLVGQIAKIKGCRVVGELFYYSIRYYCMYSVILTVLQDLLAVMKKWNMSRDWDSMRRSTTRPWGL